LLRWRDKKKKKKKIGSRVGEAGRGGRRNELKDETEVEQI